METSTEPTADPFSDLDAYVAERNRAAWVESNPLAFVGIAFVALTGALACGSIGLLVGSRVRTLEAISGLMNLIMVPMWVLSGVFFSSSNFPEVVQPFIRVLPLTALVDALRGVVLEGASLGSIRLELLTLVAWAIVPFSIGLRIFKWR